MNTLSPHVSYPVIITRDLPASKVFYQNLLDAEIVFEADWYIQMVTREGHEIGIMIEKHPSQPGFLQKAYDGNGIILTFQLANVEEKYQDIQDKNIEIIFPLRTEEWGQKHFMVRDPNNLVIDFVEHI